jgi:hypothetical protein
LALFLLLRASFEGVPDSVRVIRTEPQAEAARPVEEPRPVEEQRAVAAESDQPVLGVGALRPATAVEKTLAEGLAPPPKKLAERVALASKDAAKDEEAAEEAPLPKELSPA